MLFLGLDEIVEIHCDQIKRYGGSPNIRDIKLLQSAVAMSEAGFGNDYLHADIYEMAAAYLFYIIRNHPFIDGNKRTGAATAAVFLMLNGIELHAGDVSFVRMVRSVAEGKIAKVTVAAFFRKHASEGKHE
ncbi:MAG: type II toxin-antitoxin system death-on-curing family toxin [Deltaproteobacteria bacterium]|nr:type II toxin-antitoxin system death-on-curing family toxin [Deltaproteobacteria bacterium]